MTGTNYDKAIPVADTSLEILSNDFVIIPDRIDEDGVGYYDPQAPSLYKELLATGAKVNYYTSQRRTVHKFSAGDIVLAFAIGVGSAAAYDLLKAFVLSKLKDKPKTRVNGKIYISLHSKGKLVTQEYEIAGTAEETLKMLEKIGKVYGNGDNSGAKKA